MIKPGTQYIRQALTDPAAVFASPGELMETGLLDALKKEILRRWAYDETRLETASDEGMPERPGGDRLQEIERALKRLEEAG